MKILCLLIFLSLTAMGETQNKTTLGVIGDLNGNECQIEYPMNSIENFQNLLKSSPFEHLIFVGDLVHGECEEKIGDSPFYPSRVASMWEKFDNLFLKKLLELKMSFSLAPGNHDAPGYTHKKAFEVERQAFENYWKNKNSNLNKITLPTHPDHYPYYWAYTFKNNLYIMLQSTIIDDLTHADKQKEWIKKILESKDRKAAKKVIVAGHVPPYPVLNPSEKKHAEVLKNEQVGKPNGLMDLLIDNNVDLLLTGHSHVPYPAQLTRIKDNKSIRILSMPCSHGPRRLFGQTKRSPRGFAKIHIYDNNRIERKSSTLPVLLV